MMELPFKFEHYGAMHNLEIDPNYTVRTYKVKNLKDGYNTSPGWATLPVKSFGFNSQPRRN